MMDTTPKSLRLHIAIVGRVNVGKSSFLNMITAQDVSISSPVAGTTTDVVEKAMELLPIGPVLFLDTAGLGDDSEIADKRIFRTKMALERADIVVLVLEPETWGDYEEEVFYFCKKKKLPICAVINKIDIKSPSSEYRKNLNDNGIPFIEVSSVKRKDSEKYISSFKSMILSNIPDDFVKAPVLVRDIVSDSSLVVLVVPIDLQAPKGRLILPQVQVIREVLDCDASAIVVKEREYRYLLTQLKAKPDLVICDSQVVLKVAADTPKDVKMTTFSILFSRYKGDLVKAVKAVRELDRISENDRILIAEACTHHPIEDDIGRVKIPRWIRQYTGMELNIDVYAGKDYPLNVKDYKLIIHCGGCMLNRRLMLSRIELSESFNVPITNYGVVISYTQGVLERALSPFPLALEAFKERE